MPAIPKCGPGPGRTSGSIAAAPELTFEFLFNLKANRPVAATSRLHAATRSGKACTSGQLRRLEGIPDNHSAVRSKIALSRSACDGQPKERICFYRFDAPYLMRTIFLADYFVNPAFRRELLRVLNRGEATNALKRLIYTGRVANYQAKSEDEMQAVADALSLLANIVMA
jgi:hypothetical protein